MTLRYYHDGSTEKVCADGSRNRGSKRWVQVGISICLVSLILLAVVPTPQRFLNVGIVTRTLAVKDPTSYFEDRSREYYQRFLDGKHKSRRRVLDNANVVGVATTSGDPSVISVDEPSEFVVANNLGGNANEASGLKGGNDGEESPADGRDVIILTEHEKKEIQALKKEQALEDRPVEGVFPTTSRPSVSPSVSPSSLPSLLKSSIPTDNSPNVFAFYVKRTRHLSEDDEQLIRAWTQAWEATGYNPRILTVDDAVQHPEYVQFSDAIDAILSASSVHRPQELKPCYLRYLAMNVAGGGMMVDLDMTPKYVATETNTTIPNKFTAYCNFQTPNPRTDWVTQVETQNGLPCAVVASSDEWMRVGKLMGWVAKQHLDRQTWTDAHALQFLTNFDEVSLMKQEVAQSWRTSGWDRCHFRYV